MTIFNVFWPKLHEIVKVQRKITLSVLVMRFIKRDRSCFCYSLENGAVIIGIIFMISSAVALLMEIGMLAEWKDVQLSFKDERMRKFVHPFLIVSIALSLVYLIFSILLLKGIQQVISNFYSYFFITLKWILTISKLCTLKILFYYFRHFDNWSKTDQKLV